MDHIIISKKFRRSLLDVRVKRGADINSDHHLLICQLRPKLKAVNKLQPKTAFRFNVIGLMSKDKLDTFKISLQNRFQVLQDVVKIWIFSGPTQEACS